MDRCVKMRDVPTADTSYQQSSQMTRKTKQSKNFESKKTNTLWEGAWGELCAVWKVIVIFVHGWVLGSALRTVPCALGWHHDIDAFKVEPLDGAVVSVARNHLAHFVVRATTIAVDTLPGSGWTTSCGRHNRIPDLIGHGRQWDVGDSRSWWWDSWLGIHHVG